jgi:hypothetical protein
MSDWGISVKGMHNVADASPLQFIRKISESDAALDSGSSKTFDFSGSVPAGTTLVVWTDIAVAVLESSSQLPYRVLPINIAVSGLKVTISLESYGTGGWIFPTPRRPTGFWVFGVYGQPARGDWGAWINQGGAYPAVVNSDAGMFLTQKISTTFTGQYQLSCSENAMVFCNWTDTGVGIFFDRTTKKLMGYKASGAEWGHPGGFSIPLKICVFDIKRPTIPDWGFLVYGADRKVAFTSAETPLIIRQWAALPSYIGAWTAFSNTGATPMIPLTSIGANTTNESDIWRVNLAMNNSGVGYGPGAQFIHVGDNILDNGEQIPYRGKAIPVIWGSDYF